MKKRLALFLATVLCATLSLEQAEPMVSFASEPESEQAADEFLEEADDFAEETPEEGGNIVEEAGEVEESAELAEEEDFEEFGEEESDNFQEEQAEIVRSASREIGEDESAEEEFDSDTKQQSEETETADSLYAGDWYTDYSYELQGSYIILTSYIKELAEDETVDIEVPASATIDGTTYKTMLMYDVFHNPSIESIHFQTGVKLGEDVSNLFSDCTGLKSVDMTGVDTSEVEKMEWMFNGCENLKTVDMHGLNTSNITSLSNLFRDCSRLSSINLTGWDTSHVTDMGSMFNGCSSLASIDVSMFNTSSVKEMSSMFAGCSGLTVLDLSSFDTRKVEHMAGMFSECSSLTNLDVSMFSTPQLNNISLMFIGCSGLVELDLSSFDTKNVTNMYGIFWSCSSLTNIYVSEKWTTDNVSEGENVFSFCSNLVGGNGTAYDAEKDDYTYARIDKSGSPGYFSTKSENRIDLSSATITLPFGEEEYSGEAIEPDVVVEYDGVVLTEGVDYSVVYSNNINAGTGQIRVLGKGNYTGSANTTFTITKASAWLLGFDEYFIIKKTTDDPFFNPLQYRTDGTITYSSQNSSVATVDSTTGWVTIVGPGTTIITARASEGTNYTAAEDRNYTLKVSDQETVQWSLGDDGTLTVFGSGKMDDYGLAEDDTGSHTPWTNIKEKIKKIVISDGITRIGDGAFRGFPNLTSVYIGSGLTEIGMGAFLECEKLNDVNLPQGLICIEEEAFRDCLELKSINLPDSVCEIEQLVFYMSGLEQVSIPSGVVSIRYKTFEYSNSLNSIYIPSNITEIDRSAFSGCSSLEDVYYSGSENEWNQITFYGNDTELSNANIHFDSVDLEDADFQFSPKTFTYDGTAKKPDVSISYNGKALVNGTDYQVAYYDNVDAGEGEVVVSGMGGVFGEVSDFFQINPASITSASVTKIEDKIYTGKAITPIPVIKLGNQMLTPGEDYSLSYANNKKVGTATITIRGEGNFTGSTSTTFVIKDKTIRVKGVSLSEKSASVVKGKTLKLSATITPSNATNRKVTWKSNASSVATVSSSGVVKGIKKGTAKITVTTADGNKIASCTITVSEKAISVKSVKLNRKSATMKKGKSITLRATIKPANATNKNYSWKSSNKKVASVSSSGVVKALKKGKANITATTSDGKKTATCKIVVK